MNSMARKFQFNSKIIQLSLILDLSMMAGLGVNPGAAAQENPGGAVLENSGLTAAQENPGGAVLENSGLTAAQQNPGGAVLENSGLTAAQENPGASADEKHSVNSTEPIAAAPQKKILQGRIMNQDRLQPVEKQYRAGASIDLAKLGKLQALHPDNHWDRIPEWAAGTWVKKTSTTYYTFDYGLKLQNFDVDTGMARSAETRGWQKDRFGNIWEYSYKDYITKTECDDSWEIGLVKHTELLNASPEKIVMRFVAIRISVSKYSKRIVRSKQCESIQTYTPFAGNIVKINSSIKVFDQEGKPLALCKTLSLEQRVLPFSPQDSYKGVNTKALFIEYLNSHGMASFVPLAGAKHN